MPTVDIPDLNDPQLKVIRAQLARAYLEHRMDIGMPANFNDATIVDRVDAITVFLLLRLCWAADHGRSDLLVKFDWFLTIVDDLLADRPAKLDG